MWDLLWWFLVKWFLPIFILFFSYLQWHLILQCWFFWWSVPFLYSSPIFPSWLHFVFLFINRVRQKNWLKSISQNVPSYLLSALFPLQISWQLDRICQRLWEQAVGPSERRLHVPLIRYCWWWVANITSINEYSSHLNVVINLSYFRILNGSWI